MRKKVRRIDEKQKVRKHRKRRRRQNALTVVLAVIAVASVGIAIWAVSTRNQGMPAGTQQSAQRSAAGLETSAAEQEQSLPETDAGPEQSSPESDTGPERSAPEASSDEVEKLKDGIDLPGYGILTFKSDTLEQEMRFPNPPQNSCYIRASLILEDGTVLWTSELIEPGQSSDPVVLGTPLARGEYKNAVLKYECFLMNEERTPMNGAAVDLTLKVK